VYGHDPRADQQPNCIVGDVHAACRLEALPEPMGSASPLARCRAHDSFRVAHRGHSVTNVLAGTMRLQDQSNHKEDNPMPEIATTHAPLPADDLSRALALAQLDSPTAQHIGLVGNTYTITVAGKDTNGRFCVIDMHVPPGGGPGPHRHDFEETFILLEGEVEMTFRGAKSIVRAGDTVNVPSNAPHQFHNSSTSPARMICICAPAGNERFFVELGVPVATRTSAPPKLDKIQMAEFAKKAKAVAAKYGTELLDRA
jgi:quercetin dioxygenase-like cupin family protein